jgi:ubiquinone/menaquinone biosynthesis C-methylase UbiE
MDLKTALVFGYQAARTAHFTGQLISLPILERLATGRSRELPEDIAGKRKQAFAELTKLLKKDSENIAKGIYPLEVLKPEAFGQHWRRFGKIIWDGVQVSRRRNDRNQRDFDKEAQEHLEEVPEYYRRNFHFQTGGYLTKHSAEIYEHQVEILFAGGGDAMRRLILPLMKKKWSGNGEGLHFLEIAGGTGRLTRFVKLAYPKARITVTDLSWPYLQMAQKRLMGMDRLEFVQSAAEKLPFPDGTFDAVYSCFLFHELPEAIRGEVVREGRRVLKRGGAFGLVDSLQKHDAEDFAWALEGFPQDFHEPFFKNYTLKSVEDLLLKEGFEDIDQTRGFLSKAVLASKPDSIR